MKSFEIRKIKTVDSDKVDIAEIATGNFIKGTRNSSEPTIEMEEGEYVKFPDGETLKGTGEKHSKGGIQISKIPGTRFLTDKGKPNASQRKKLEKDLDIKVKPTDTFSDVLDKFTAKIGLKKLIDQQADVFREIQKQQEKIDVDSSTLKVNNEFLSEKVKSLENRKQSLEARQTEMFDQLYEMQEMNKPAKERALPEDKFMYGGISKERFEKACQKHGMSIEEGMAALKWKDGIMAKAKKYAEGGQEPGKGGIFVEADKTLLTGDKLTQNQKDNLVAFYERHNKDLSRAFKSGRLKWEEHVFNPGLVSDLDKFGPDAIEVMSQKKDVPSKFKFGTYGNMTDERVSGFLLKDYYEAINPGKKFEDMSNAEINKLQTDYNTALYDSKDKVNYYSGASGDSETGDGMFGNRTASYIRRNQKIKGTKSGTIDVDKLFSLTDEQIDAELKDYGLTAADLKPYQNAAYKYINIEEKATEPEKDKKPPVDVEMIDHVKRTPRKDYPRLFFNPDQRPLAPSPLEANLTGDLRLGRLNPLKIGIENNLTELARERNFAVDNLDSLPEGQRAAVIANLAASTQRGANEAAYRANVANADNQSKTDIFNIGQSAEEQLFDYKADLNFEERQMRGKANTEEQVRSYYDRLNKLNITNFKNQQNLNLIDSLYPDFELDFMGMATNFSSEGEYQYDPKKAELYDLLNGEYQKTTKET